MILVGYALILVGTVTAAVTATYNGQWLLGVVLLLVGAIVLWRERKDNDDNYKESN